MLITLPGAQRPSGMGGTEIWWGMCDTSRPARGTPVLSLLLTNVDIMSDSTKWRELGLRIPSGSRGPRSGTLFGSFM